MSDAITALRDVLREAREDARLSFAQVAAYTDKGETVFRRLENGTASPRISEISEYVAAYGQATKTDPFELWRRAIERAEAARALAEYEDSEEGDAQMAADGIAQADAAESAQEQPQSDDSPSSKGKKHRAG